MPKPKQFLKERKARSKPGQQAPRTADEYLAVGVEKEEAGEKWRGGDVVKAARFFGRAIDTYDEGLRRFPESFDLAYNKARLQYDLTQYPRLVSQIPGSLLDLLTLALNSSRHALRLQQDNANVLFNTAQVLVSIAETTSESRSVHNAEIMSSLEEAIELFQRCLTIQELQHEESLARAEAFGATSKNNAGDSSLPNPNSETTTVEQVEEWASIQEPTTRDDLLDTLLAQVRALSLLCAFITAEHTRGLAWIEEFTAPLLSQKLPFYLSETTDRESEAALTRANFICVVADANFRDQNIDTSTYERTIADAFSASNITNDAQTLCDRAEVLMSFNTALRLSGAQDDAVLSRWRALTSALEDLTTASKLPDVKSVAKIHLLRGDVELSRVQLGRAPINFETARNNTNTLVKNAEKFYRGAAALAARDGEKEDVLEAKVKEALANALDGGGGGLKLQEVLGLDEEGAKAVLDEAVEDGVVTAEDLRAMKII